MKKRLFIAALILSLLTAFSVRVFAQELTIDKKHVVSNEQDYSPFVEQHYPSRVFWGDTHLHTRNSLASSTEWIS